MKKQGQKAIGFLAFQRESVAHGEIDYGAMEVHVYSGYWTNLSVVFESTRDHYDLEHLKRILETTKQTWAFSTGFSRSAIEIHYQSHILSEGTWSNWYAEKIKNAGFDVSTSKLLRRIINAHDKAGRMSHQTPESLIQTLLEMKAVPLKTHDINIGSERLIEDTGFEMKSLVPTEVK